MVHRKAIFSLVAATAIASGAMASFIGGCGATANPSDSSGDDNVILAVRGLTSSLDATGAGRSAPGSTGAIVQFKELPQVTIDPFGLSGNRHFYLGAVPIGAPSPIVTDAYLDGAIAFTAKGAECFVIRQKVDWEAYRPGGIADPDFTNDILKLLTKARAAGFIKTLVELDPIVDRHEIGPLPPAIANENFGGPSVREAMRRQVVDVVTKGRPDYLSFAVEVNGYFQSHPDDFQNFVSLHKELYDLAKAIAPDTVVMPSFNLESMKGLLKGVNEFENHDPEWPLIGMFQPKADAVAFSTLPFPVFYRPVQIPDSYLTEISDHTNLPIVLSEIGWTSTGGSNESQQRDYVGRMAKLAVTAPKLKVMAWTIFFDAGDGSIFDSFPDFKFLGLLSAYGQPKSAFTAWASLYQMPLVPPEQP